MAGRTLQLPASPDVWVELKTDIPAQSRFEFNEASVRRIPGIVAEALAGWNLADDEDQEIPLTANNLARYLPSEDIWHIAGQMYSHDDDTDYERAVMLTIAGGDDCPWDYLVYKYRRIFRVSFPDFVKTPLKVIRRDIMTYNLEAQYQQSQQPEESNG